MDFTPRLHSGDRVIRSFAFAFAFAFAFVSVRTKEARTKMYTRGGFHQVAARRNTRDQQNNTTDEKYRLEMRREMGGACLAASSAAEVRRVARGGSAQTQGHPLARSFAQRKAFD